MSNEHFISIVMPALNEEKNILSAISSTLETFDRLKIDGELIVINDGSSDTTEGLVKSAMAKEGHRMRLISHGAPQGIGVSFWDGISEARGEIVAMLPGDNENEPYEILRYIKLMDDVDIVVPFVYNKRVRSVFRNILSYLCLLIIDITFGVYFNYTNGTNLYRRRVLNDLDYKSRSFFFQADILIRLVKKGYLFAEVPYRLGLRRAGASKAVTFNNFIQVVKDYFRLVRDIYLRKEERLRRYKFVEGSISRRRYDELGVSDGRTDTGRA